MPGTDRASHREKIFLGSVLGNLYTDGSRHAHFVLLREHFPALFGQVGHLVNAVNPLLIQPLGHLLSGKSR